MQLPSTLGDWTPLNPSQYIDASGAQALTIPTLPAGQVAKGAMYVAILTPQSVAVWIRTDGQNPSGTVLTGRKVNVGDYEIVYGYACISKIRVIRDAAGGALCCEYYYFRPL